MKPTIKTQLLTATIALSLLLGLTSAQAQFVVNQTNAAVGDLILGFETTGGSGSTDLLVDLGSTANSNALSGLNINLGSDLTTAFGANYATTVSYGLYSVNSARDIFASAPTSQTTGYFQTARSSVPYTSFASMLGVYNNNGVVGQPAPFTGYTTANGVIETAVTTYSWSYFTPSSQAFGNAYYANIEVPIGSGVNLFEMLPSNVGGYGTLYNNLQFQVSTSGVFSAVPEPSTYGLMALGSILLASLAYRKRVSKAKA